MRDSQDDVVDTAGTFVPTDDLRALLFHSLRDDVVPGDYWVVLKVAGEEIVRRPLTILSRTSRFVANGQCPLLEEDRIGNEYWISNQSCLVLFSAARTCRWQATQSIVICV
jgi:hypothetical protein